MSVFAISGSARATTDGALGPSGSPVRVYAAAMAVVGTIAGVFQLRNGTSSSADTWVEQTNESTTGGGNQSRVVFFGSHGILFSAGCFYDHGTSNTAVVFQYSVEV